MANVTSTSTQFTLKLNDLWKGLLVAVLTPVITVIIESLNQGSLTFNWKSIAITALTAGLAYILKNFLTPSQIVIKDAETVKAVKEGDAEVKVVNK